MSERAASRADFPAVTDGDNAIERGRAIKERFDALGYGYREFEELTGVGRKTLHRAFNGQSTDMTYTAIESHLDRLEARAQGKAVPMPQGVQQVDQPTEGMVRITLKGVFGAEAAIVEAPVGNPDALAAALDVVMRRMQKDADEQADTES